MRPAAFQFLESRVLKIELFLQGRKQFSERMERERRKSLRITEVRMFKRKRRNLMCNFLHHFSENLLLLFVPSSADFAQFKKEKLIWWQIFFLFPGNGLGYDAYFCARKKRCWGPLFFALIKKWILLLHMWIYFADTIANLSRHQIEAQIDVPFPLL